MRPLRSSSQRRRIMTAAALQASHQASTPAPPRRRVTADIAAAAPAGGRQVVAARHEATAPLVAAATERSASCPPQRSRPAALWPSSSPRWPPTPRRWAGCGVVGAVRYGAVGGSRLVEEGEVGGALVGALPSMQLQAEPCAVVCASSGFACSRARAGGAQPAAAAHGRAAGAVPRCAGRSAHHAAGE